jgi:hypothetical protein
MVFWKACPSALACCRVGFDLVVALAWLLFCCFALLGGDL